MARTRQGWEEVRDERGLVTIRPHGRAFRVAPSHSAVWDAFLNDYGNSVEPFTGGVLDDWSYNRRLVRGSRTVLSEHSAAQAVDVNALQHPRGVRGTFSREQLRALRRLLDRYPMIVWGGDFQSVPDEMHFEMRKGTPNTVAIPLTIERLLTMELSDRIESRNPESLGKDVSVRELLQDMQANAATAARDADHIARHLGLKK